jgi:hypothetical protein
MAQVKRECPPPERGPRRDPPPNRKNSGA